MQPKASGVAFVQDLFEQRPHLNAFIPMGSLLTCNVLLKFWRIGDHIGENLVTPAAYGHMTHMLKSLAGGKIILALEGGYNLDSIAVSGLACTKALLSDPIGSLNPIIPNDACIQTIHEVIEVQSRYWRSLTPMCIDPAEGEFVYISWCSCKETRQIGRLNHDTLQAD